MDIQELEAQLLSRIPTGKLEAIQILSHSLFEAKLRT